MIRRGLQALISRRTHISKASLSLIFSGRRRATPAQAEKLEQAFIENGIPLNRWDLLYGAHKGQSLVRYLKCKDDL